MKQHVFITKIDFALLVGLLLCLVVSVPEVLAQVRVTFQLLSGSPTPSQLATQLNSLFISGSLNASLGYPVISLSTFSQPSSPTSSSSPASSPSQSRTSGAVESSSLLSIWIVLLFTLVSLLPFVKKQFLKTMLLLFLVHSNQIEAVSRNYRNCRLLDNQIQYKLYWTLNSNSIDIGLEAKSGGWIAFGLSGNGYMNSGGVAPGSDIWMGYIDSSTCPNGCVNDYYTLLYDTPKLDTQNDILPYNVSEVNGVLSVEFSRPLDTGDTEHDRVITPSTPMYIIWSANVNQKPSSPSVFAKHTHRPDSVPITIDWSQPSLCIDSSDVVQVVIVLDISMNDWNANTFQNNMATTLGIPSYRINILNVEDISPPICPECLQVVLTAENYTVPSQVTTYVCRGFQLPTDKPRQIIRLEPILDNKLVLHHMVLFTMSTPWSLNTYTSCPMMPNGSQPFFAWAPGGSAMDMPRDVGFQIDTSNPYVVIQYHYNNGQQLSGQVDNSGFRLYLTENLRPNLAGLLMFGIPIISIAIPPNIPNWHQSGTCNKTQTDNLRYLPGGNITVFAYMLHAHLLGRKIWTVHYRNNAPIGYLGNNLAYDFNQQTFEETSTTILPGDELVTHCIWDSTGRNSTTYGGESTYSEMCVNLALYYPQIPGTRCYSSFTSGGTCDYPCPSNP